MSRTSTINYLAQIGILIHIWEKFRGSIDVSTNYDSTCRFSSPFSDIPTNVREVISGNISIKVWEYVNQKP